MFLNGENFPYTNFHDLNLDWIIKTLREVNDKFDDAIASGVTIADPPEWQSGTAYDELTIVFSGSNAYLSTQPVPTGIPLTNTDYWTPILDMSSLFDAIAQLQNYVDTNYEKKTSTKRILFCGDSYVLWNNSRLFNKFVSLLPVDPSHITNVAISGSSFSNPGNNYITQIMNYTGDKTAITDIIIAGGINDALPAYGNYDRTYPNISALTGPMQSFIDYVHTHYPNATAHIAYIGGCMADSEYYNDHPPKAQEMAFYAYTVEASGMGYNVLAGYNTIHMTPDFYYTDGLHPNVAGSDTIASTIAKSFLGKPVVEVRPIVSKPIETTSGIASSVSLPFQYRIINDITEMTLNNGFWLIQTGGEIGANPVEVATLSGSQTVVRGEICVPCTFILGQFDGITGRIPVPGSLILKNGKVYIELYQFEGSGWKTFTALAGANITIEAVHISTPTFNIN